MAELVNANAVPATGVLSQSYSMVSVDDLVQHPENPRRGDVGALVESVRANGFYGALVVQASSGYVLAGNHRLAAARREGIAELPVVTVDVDDERARRILLADNRINDLATYDDESLIGLLSDLPDLVGTGYTDDDLAALLGGPGDDVEGLTDRDEVPDTAPAIVAPGDVWLLGPHRLICGDSTDPAVVAALVGQERCDVMWTDPPYGVEYVGKTKDALTIKNDGSAGLPELMRGFLTVAREGALRAGAPGYVCTAPGPLQTVVAENLTDTGWSLRQQLIWVKDSMVLGHLDYHARHEPIWMAYTPAPKGSGRLGRGGQRWYGDHSQTTVLEIPRPKRSAEHPTMKPVELVRRLLQNSCPTDGVVYEPFGGSGTTLIAAHSLGARARVIELDPRYCDVICRRWEEHTGSTPVLESTGEARTFCVDIVPAVETEED